MTQTRIRVFIRAGIVFAVMCVALFAFAHLGPR